MNRVVSSWLNCLWLDGWVELEVVHETIVDDVPPVLELSQVGRDVAADLFAAAIDCHVLQVRRVMLGCAVRCWDCFAGELNVCHCVGWIWCGA